MPRPQRDPSRKATRREEKKATIKKGAKELASRTALGTVLGGGAGAAGSAVSDTDNSGVPVMQESVQDGGHHVFNQIIAHPAVLSAHDVLSNALHAGAEGAKAGAAAVVIYQGGKAIHHVLNKYQNWSGK